MKGQGVIKINTLENWDLISISLHVFMSYVSVKLIFCPREMLIECLKHNLCNLYICDEQVKTSVPWRQLKKK